MNEGVLGKGAGFKTVFTIAITVQLHSRSFCKKPGHELCCQTFYTELFFIHLHVCMYYIYTLDNGIRTLLQ